MRRFPLLCVLVLAFGCGKKAAQEEADEPAPPPPRSTPPPSPPPPNRVALLKTLQTGKPDARRNASDTLARLADTDAQVIPELIALLKNPTTDPAADIHPGRFNSTREAAAITLLAIGPKGEAALRSQGLPILQAALADPNPAIRRHTAYTLGLLGPLAKSVAPAVQKLCTDPDPKVRSAAFAAVKSLGLADPVAMAALLTHKEPDIGPLAAELIAPLAEIPDGMIPPLTAALESDTELIRLAAAEALGTAGNKAGPKAADQLAAVLRKTYPADANPMMAWREGQEFAYWQALVRIGPPAVPALTGLLTYPYPLVRAYAAQSLGEIMPPSKAAAPTLLKVLQDDRYAVVIVAAACALCRIGENQAEAAKRIQDALNAPDARVNGFAIEAVARMGPAGKELIEPALGKADSTDPYTRYAVAELIGSLDAGSFTKALPALRKLLVDQESVIRERAGRVLEKLGPAAAPAAADLGKALASEKESAVRDQFLDALSAMGPGARPAVPGVLPIITDTMSDRNTRVKAIRAAATDAANPAVGPALEQASADRDEEIRAAAITAMGQLDPIPRATLAVMVKTANSDPEYAVRAAAARGLAAAGPRARAVRSDLEALTKLNYPGLAVWGRVALARADGNVAAATGAVRAGLEDKNSQARGAAAEALLLIGPTASDLPVILKLLGEDLSGLREAGARAAGKLGPVARAAVPRLIELLDDPAGKVAECAVSALGEMGSAALPAVVKLRQLAKDNPSLAPVARKALERLGVKTEKPKG